MSSEPTNKLPAQNQETNPDLEERMVDPRDLVYKGGYTGNPQEIVQNPAVTPQMLNEPGDLRHDVIEDE